MKPDWDYSMAAVPVKRPSVIANVQVLLSPFGVPQGAVVPPTTLLIAVATPSATPVI